MRREDAFKVLDKLVTNENLRRHHLAAGAVMRAIALKIKNQKNASQDSLRNAKIKIGDIGENKWEVVGLLHDADYEMTKDRPAEHGVIIMDEARSIVGEIPPDIAEAIKFHNKDNVAARESLMGWAIYTCDELTGLIVACALVQPEKKLATVDGDFVLRKMKEPAFAKGARREQIYLCEEKLGIPLPEFVEISLSGMKGVAKELGL